MPRRSPRKTRWQAPRRAKPSTGRWCSGWGAFKRMLAYKAPHLIKVSTRDTSRTCHACRQGQACRPRYAENVPEKLCETVHGCPGCRLITDRDKNAAANSLNRGVVALRTRNMAGYSERASRNFRLRH